MSPIFFLIVLEQDREICFDVVYYALFIRLSRILQHSQSVEISSQLRYSMVRFMMDNSKNV